MTYEEIMSEARDMGRAHGQAAASWYFDGNTTDETYRLVLQGIEDGDPEVLDSFPSAPLSGEWADDPTPQTLAEDLGLDNEDDDEAAVLDDACSAYEDAFYQSVHEEIERMAREHLEPQG
jgi:hypothetical protein